MKCPKCNYLGFETGDRCKNCGYDFSFLDEPEAPRDFDLDIDLGFRSSDDTLPVSVAWDDNYDSTFAVSAATLEIAEPRPSAAAEPVHGSAAPAIPVGIDRKLPLFGPAVSADENDEPLIKLPAAPRAPLAVRRTPDAPRLRAVPRPAPKPSRPIEAAPALNFVDELPIVAGESIADTRARTASRLAARESSVETSGPAARLAAAAIDLALLGAIDLAVVYFTLRMTGLTLAEFPAFRIVPLVAFLLLIKFSYLSAFTAVGGQTIGKMAARIRVVTAEDDTPDGSLAVKRALAGLASAALLGLGFLPALIGSDRRALHDRLTRTRVVTLPSA